MKLLSRQDETAHDEKKNLYEHSAYTEKHEIRRRGRADETARAFALSRTLMIQFT